MSTLSWPYITAGAAVRGPVRRVLEEMKFQGVRFEYLESKGFIESRFSLRGPDASAVVRAIGRRFGFDGPDDGDEYGPSYMGGYGPADLDPDL